MGATQRVEVALEQMRQLYPEIDLSSKRLIYAFFQLADAMSKFGQASLAELGLNWGEYVVLATLRRSGGKDGMTPKTLLEDIGLTSGGMSSVLRRLEARSLIRRSTSEHDKRFVVVTLTPQGRKLADKAIPYVARREQEFLSVLPREKQERLYSVLRDVLDHIGSEPVRVGQRKPPLVAPR